jgi:hypothetical protein
MSVKLILALFCFIPIVANAKEVEQTCWPYYGNNDFRVTLTKGSFSRLCPSITYSS